MIIGIVGLGLIGGSIAKAIKEKTNNVVYGFDNNVQTLKNAYEQGVIDAQLTDGLIPVCNVIILALYPRRAVQFVHDKADMISEQTVVVDVCGVKRYVCDSIAEVANKHGFTHIGAHPMAGIEKSGFDFSKGELFNGASMILTPNADTDKDHIKNISSLFLSIGFGKITISTPEEHDMIIAYTSQLAHVLSSAYIKSSTADKFNGFSAGSFRDMTRVAWLNEEMWTELFLENADFLADEVETLASNLMEYANAIRANDDKELYRLLHEGRVLKEKVDKLQ